MDSAINMHLAITKLQDSLRDAEAARDARAHRGPRRRRPHGGLATAGQRKRHAPMASRLSSGAMTHH
jgi:hypothetical protein